MDLAAGEKTETDRWAGLGQPRWPLLDLCLFPGGPRPLPAMAPHLFPNCGNGMD